MSFTKQAIDIAFVLGFLSAIWLWARATRQLQSGSVVSRFADGAVVLGWVLLLSFNLLSNVGLFRRDVALLLLWSSGWGALWIAGRCSGRRFGGVALGPPDLRAPSRWIFLPLAAFAAVRLVKGLISPPLAWDALTYHLPKAVFWIQSGRRQLPDFPDAWTYYRWFPSGGEVLQSWAMLPTHSDLLLGPFGFLVWSLTLIAAARLARQLGATDETAWIAGAALSALPAVFAFMTANYVDTLLVFLYLCAVSHTISFLDKSEPRHAILGALAMGLAIAIKSSMLPLLVPTVLPLLVWTWLRERSPKLLLGVGVALLVPGLHYVRAWAVMGSPLYPFKTPVFSWLPHHQGLASLMSSTDTRLLQPFWYQFTQHHAPHLNLGYGGLPLLIGGVVGVAICFARNGHRMRGLTLVLGTLLVVGLSLSTANRGQWIIFTDVHARLLMPGLAPLLLAFSVLPPTLSRLLAMASLALSSIHFVPLGWPAVASAPAAVLSMALLAAFSSSLLATRWLRRRHRLTGPGQNWAVIGAALLVALLLCAPLRQQTRHAIYAEAAWFGAYDAHEIDESVTAVWSLWECVDTEVPRRFGIAVGPVDNGHNQAFYPLFGSQLQNTLVPIKEPPRSLSARQFPDWFADLESLHLDAIVGWGAPTGVREWIASRPDAYRIREMRSRPGAWVAFRQGLGDDFFLSSRSCQMD